MCRSSSTSIIIRISLKDIVPYSQLAHVYMICKDGVARTLLSQTQVLPMKPELSHVSETPVNLILSSSPIESRRNRVWSCADMSRLALPYFALVRAHQIDVFVSSRSPAIDSFEEEDALHARISMGLDQIIKECGRSGTSPSTVPCVRQCRGFSGQGLQPG